MGASTSNRAAKLYRVVLEGGRNAAWEDFMEEVTVSTTEVDGHRRTILEGWVADQAALFGLVANACDLGLVLVSIEPLER